MGAEVKGVPGRAPVAGPENAGPVAAQESFGPWFRRQREVRAISVFFVAARTKLSPERVRALEAGAEQLGRGGHERATARALACAIGADPEEAVARLGAASRGAPRPHREGDWRPHPLARWTRPAVAALLIASGLWLLAEFLLRSDPPNERPTLVYRPDYVHRLLDR